MRNKITLLFGANAILLIASCNDSKEQSSKTTVSSDNNKTEPVSPGGSTATPNINLTVTGGDMAGSYSATCKDGCCSWGIAGANVFGNQYSETGKGTKDLSSVQLIVDNVTGNKSTKEFTLTVSFGELFSNGSKSFNIDTRNGNKRGSGTLDLQYSGDKATVSIKGVSAEGPSIDLKMDCNKVTTSRTLN
jgi:hypothetical protein